MEVVWGSSGFQKTYLETVGKSWLEPDHRCEIGSCHSGAHAMWQQPVWAGDSESKGKGWVENFWQEAGKNIGLEMDKLVWLLAVWRWASYLTFLYLYLVLVWKWGLQP